MTKVFTWLHEPQRNKTHKMTCVPKDDSDQPGQPPSLISLRVCLGIVWVLNYLLSAQQRLWSDLADAQADLSLRWALMLFCRICHAPTSIYRIACWTRFGLVMLAWPGSNYRNTQLVRKPLTQPFPFGNHGHQLYRKKLFIIRARAVLKNITMA